MTEDVKGITRELLVERKATHILAFHPAFGYCTSAIESPIGGPMPTWTVYQDSEFLAYAVPVLAPRTVKPGAALEFKFVQFLDEMIQQYTQPEDYMMISYHILTIQESEYTKDKNTFGMRELMVDAGTLLDRCYPKPHALMRRVVDHARFLTLLCMEAGRGKPN